MRRQVLEVQCSRCARVETVPSEKAAEKVEHHVFEARLGEMKVEFEDLCTPCQRTVHALLEQIGRKIDGVSPARAGRSKAKATPEPVAKVLPHAHPVDKKEEPAPNGPAPRVHTPAVASRNAPLPRSS